MIDDPTVRTRATMPDVAQMSAEQKSYYDQSFGSIVGGPYGPRMILLHDPELLAAWSALGAALQKADFPARLRELAILVTARHWDSQFEWHAHEPVARSAGVPDSVVEAIKMGRTPAFGDAADAAVYDYCRELHETRRVGDAVYARARQALGDRGLIQMTALVGHYANVAMTLEAHQAALPPGVEPPLPPLKDPRH